MNEQDPTCHEAWVSKEWDFLPIRSMHFLALVAEPFPKPKCLVPFPPCIMSAARKLLINEYVFAQGTAPWALHQMEWPCALASPSGVSYMVYVFTWSWEETLGLHMMPIASLLCSKSQRSLFAQTKAPAFQLPYVPRKMFSVKKGRKGERGEGKKPGPDVPTGKSLQDPQDLGMLPESHRGVWV